jgi:hypothetical protein
MSSLSAIEKRTFERLFAMGSGYVLNFSNRTFDEFVLDTVRISIWDPKYERASGSKANRLRAFWDLEPDHTVGRLLGAMLDLMERELDPDPDLFAHGRSVCARLLGAAAVDDLGALRPNAEETDFELLARTVHDAINAGEPQAGLDRLHTFVAKYVQVLAEREGIQVTKDKALHAAFGELVKALRARGAIETEMAERILRSSISTLESFNTVRNDRSFAHPNPLLSFDEALLIFRNVASTVRFLNTIAPPPKK